MEEWLQAEWGLMGASLSMWTVTCCHCALVILAIRKITGLQPFVALLPLFVMAKIRVSSQECQRERSQIHPANSIFKNITF